MSSQAAAAAGGSSTGGSAAQQANDMTRNILLGIPKEGLPPNSSEAAELHAAEAFVGDIQQEILAYDIANAKAMEAYAMKWWSRIPFFGRHAKQSLEAATAVAAAASTAPPAASSSRHAGLHLSAEEVAAASSANGGVYLHTQTTRTSRGQTVERTSAIEATRLTEFAQGAGVSAATRKATGAPSQPFNSWLFRRQHPGWVPLIQRWWVPWICAASIALIWTPDPWKLRTLYYCDYQYAMLRQNIHKTYWRLTMTPEDYAALMADIEASRPPSVKSTDCPF